MLAATALSLALALAPQAPPSLKACKGESDCISSNGLEAPNHFQAPLAFAPKTRDKAFAELKKAVTEYPGATIIKASVEDRYLYAEVEDGLTGIKDDVEFLFSLNNPIVGYRSAPRVGGDAKRQKVRIRDLRKTLQESGWKSVGRAVNLAE